MKSKLFSNNRLEQCRGELPFEHEQIKLPSGGLRRTLEILGEGIDLPQVPQEEAERPQASKKSDEILAEKITSSPEETAQRIKDNHWIVY